MCFYYLIYFAVFILRKFVFADLEHSENQRTPKLKSQKNETENEKKVSLKSIATFALKSIGDTACDTSYEKYWRYFERYWKSIGDTKR